MSALFVDTEVVTDVQELLCRKATPVSSSQSFLKKCGAPPCNGRRCVAMLSHLYHSPTSEPCGSATVGCTEACLLSGLAAKKLWQAQQKAHGKSTDRPNLVVGAHFQVRASEVPQGAWSAFRSLLMSWHRWYRRHIRV